MSEQLTPSSVEANNAELSQAAKEAQNRYEEGNSTRAMLTEEQDGSLPINKEFNQGVVQGPALPSEGQINQLTDAGWDRDESMKMLADEEQARRIRVNAYPIGLVGEQKDVHDALEARAQESQDLARPAPAVEQEVQPTSHKSALRSLSQRALSVFAKK